MVQEMLGNTIAQLLQVPGQNKGYDLQQTLCALQHLPTLVQKAACPREMHPLPPATGQQVEARVENIAAQGEKAASTSLPSEISTQGSRELQEEPGAAAPAAADPQEDPSDEGLPKSGEAEDLFIADGKEGEEDVPMAPLQTR